MAHTLQPYCAESAGEGMAYFTALPYGMPIIFVNTSIDNNSRRRPGLGSRVSLSGLGGTHSIG